MDSNKSLPYLLVTLQAMRLDRLGDLSIILSSIKENI